ncbi:MAG TPA: hypothetical protein VFI27_02545 [candidate division Zixibacteria bacterium]|nr:hypothetical protein [candidate division Zixibacteria bacterium]
MKIIVAVVFILHGLVHGILAMVPSPGANEPVFATFFSSSWLGLSDSAGKPLAFILATLATVGFVAAGLGLLDFLVPFDWWRTLAAVSAVISLLLLVIFWHPYVIVGVVIDVVILVVVLFTDWTPE